MGNSDNVIGYIEYLSDDGKIIGYVTPFTDVDKFRKEILEAAEVGMPITPVVFPDAFGIPSEWALYNSAGLQAAADQGISEGIAPGHGAVHRHRRR